LDPEFVSIIKAMRSRDEAHYNFAKDKLREGAIPTPQEVVDIVNRAVGNSRVDILSHHTFRHEKSLRDGFNSLVTCAHAAFVDICKLQAAIVPHHSSAQLQGDFDYVVMAPYHKELIAFSAAAYGIVNIVRRIRSVRPDLDNLIGTLNSEISKTSHKSFLFDLRRNLSHGSVVLPRWSIKISDGVESGSMKLNIKLMLALGEWSQTTKAYLSSIRDEEIDLTAEISKYNKDIRVYAEEMSSLFHLH
jgi:hypothetical protein